MGLTLLQHRGQDAAGILSHDEKGFHFIKQLGLVSDIFTPEKLNALSGNVALGHVRYSTVGSNEISSVQPFFINYPYGIGMIHNGNLVNFKRVSRELMEESHRHPLTGSDTEVILNLFAESLSKNLNPPKSATPSIQAIEEAVLEVFNRAIGSYSIVTLIAGFGLVAFKDPNGIRPLTLSRRKEPDGSTSTLFSSESSVPSFLEYDSSEEVKAGEMIIVTLDGQITRKVLGNKESRPCMFEWVYFASPQSEIEESTVYSARIELGKNLARKIKVEIAEGRMKPDVVVPVPMTAQLAAISLSEELGIPYREVLIKNRYISRTFILDTQDKREKAVQLKLFPVDSEIRGKNILLVDDSIVRGTTSRKLIEVVRNAGAKSVYFVSSAPPIRYPCFYGIDFPHQKELIAFEKTDSEIEKALGADRVIYQDIDALVESVQPKKGNKRITPCTACLNQCYPTSIEDSAEFTSEREHPGSEVFKRG
jgi:amidophosphoribosyltransferase